MLLLEWDYDPNRLQKAPIQHLLAKLKGDAYSYIKKKTERKEVICFHCEGLENADKFGCLSLSYTEKTGRLLNLHVYQPGEGRRF